MTLRLSPLQLQDSGVRWLLSALILLTLPLFPTSVTATAIAQTSLQIYSLTITPSSGFVVFSPYVDVYASAGNSLGESESHEMFGVGNLTVSSQATWAYSTSSADWNTQTASAYSNFNVPGTVVGDAGGENYAFLIIQPFTIVGATGPVLVTFNASVGYSQFLMTDHSGNAASSLLRFIVNVNETRSDQIRVIDQMLGYEIGRSSSYAASGQWDLSNSVMLDAGVPYLDFEAYVRIMSSVSNAPEPSTFVLMVGGLGLIVASRMFRA